MEKVAYEQLEAISQSPHSTVYLANRYKYEDKWNDLEKEGKGMFYDIDGTKYKQVWKNGEMISKIKIP
jgi:hypothetical protein